MNGGSLPLLTNQPASGFLFTFFITLCCFIQEALEKPGSFIRYIYGENPAAEKMFCYKSDEIIGKPIEILIPEKFKAHHHHLRAGFDKHPSHRAMEQNRDLYGRREDGSNLPVEISVSHYQKDDDLFAIALIVDKIRRKEIESDMKKQQAELERIGMSGEDQFHLFTSFFRGGNVTVESKLDEGTTVIPRIPATADNL